MGNYREPPIPIVARGTEGLIKNSNIPGNLWTSSYTVIDSVLKGVVDPCTFQKTSEIQKPFHRAQAEGISQLT